MAEPPQQNAFTRAERRLIAGLDTPARVQRWLRDVSYNWAFSCHSFRTVVRKRTAHCLEAAIASACILEQHGFPPLVVSLESKDRLDHVLYVFRAGGKWGAIAKSRDLALLGRKAAYRSIRDLAWSYFDPYIDRTGRITGYALADLRELGAYDWRFSAANVWKVERFLQGVPHTRLRSSNARYRRWHRRYLQFAADHPGASPTYFQGRSRWLW